MTQRTDAPDDDVGIRPSRVPRITLPAKGTPKASTDVRCIALFELFRGGAGPVQLGRLHDGRDAPRLVALRGLANFPTRELESAAHRAKGVTHPRLAKVLGTYRYEDTWYIASEYVSGVTLFELGQTAVRQRKPISAAAAVRIVLDALRVTAEAAQLIDEERTSARCLYPESLWISDFGELFLAEFLVAPVLARITTGASYVAVTAGMSAPASDVRAAAVELARLACARLMNGNPASWQTPELPEELSALLARAVTGGPGTETPTAFAHALSLLTPSLIAERDEVRAEVERLMGTERSRRDQQLELYQQQTGDLDTTRVLRVAPAPKLPDFEKSLISNARVDVATARRAGASTLPPPKLASASTLPPKAQLASTSTLPPSKAQLASASTLPPPRGARARKPTSATPTQPTAPPTPPPEVDSTDSPISGVWREAHLKIGVPGRRTRRKLNSVDMDALTPAPVPVPGAPIAEATATAPVAGGRKRGVIAALAVFALSALIGATWLLRSSESSGPSTTQQGP